jgi:hypothetical protein
VCFRGQFQIQIATPTEAELNALSDELFVRAFKEIKPAASAPSEALMGMAMFGVAAASSKPEGGERRSGGLIAADLTALFGNRVGLAIDAGFMTGYSYGGGAAEIRFAGGGGAQLGPLVLMASAGGIMSLLGESDPMAGSFTRHLGLIGAARMFLVSGPASIGFGAGATYGVHADQRRLEVAARVASWAAMLRYIEHGEHGDPVVARSVIIFVGAGF